MLALSTRRLASGVLLLLAACSSSSTGPGPGSVSLPDSGVPNGDAEAAVDAGAADVRTSDSTGGDAVTAPDAGALDTGASGGGFTSGSACTSAQTQFAFTALGDANPQFTTGVGVRAPGRLLAFTGSSAPAFDGGGGDAGGAVNTIYWQAFDTLSAQSLGAAKPLTSFTDADATGSIYLEDASIAPTGEIALLFTHLIPGSELPPGLSAVFFSSETSDGGDAEPQVTRVVQLETEWIGSPAELVAAGGQAHAIWSTQANEFIFSWTYHPNNGGVLNVKVAKYLPSGASAGGGTDSVPTGPTYPGDVQNESGSVATTGALLGVAYIPAGGVPRSLTLLDGTGNAVAAGVPVTSSPALYTSGPAGYNWVAAAGTSTGIVYLDGTQPVSEQFIPIGSSGPVDGGDAGFSGFTTTGTQGAVMGRALSDYSSGVGGVAAALLYPDAVSLLYVNSDGITHFGPSQAFSHAQAADDEISITEFAGSFGLALYSAADHRMQIAASGCIK